MTDLSNLAANLEAANHTARWVQQQLAKASMDSDGVALEALIAQRDDAERDAKRVLAERNAVIAERDALALKLEATTRELECRTTERDAAIVERDDARKCNFRLQQEARELRETLDGVAQEPSTLEEAIAALDGDPFDGVTPSDGSADTREQLIKDAVEALREMFSMLEQERRDAVDRGDAPPSWHDDPRVLKLFFPDLFFPGSNVGTGPSLHRRLEALVAEASPPDDGVAPLAADPSADESVGATLERRVADLEAFCSNVRSSSLVAGASPLTLRAVEIDVSEVPFGG